MTATTVPSILKYLSDSSNYDDQNIEAPIRAKKRRLDHLSWEEKIQRKKLKNRVAAQTSRDRKKAKMDQMDQAIQDLFTKNETLVAECENLKKLNERLMEENRELNSRHQMPCMMCNHNRSVECESESGSAARNSHTLSSGCEQTVTTNNGTGEDCTSLPSLPDLLDELNNDVDISSLEQLTQSLLQDIARDLEAAAEKADYQESVASRQESSGEMVGPSSKDLESSRSDVLEKPDHLIKDISEYLLLHHNYSAKPQDEERHKKIKSPSTLRRVKTKSKAKSKPKPQQILPKISETIVNDRLAPIGNDLNNEVLYGTFDENSNCITIFVQDDDSISQPTIEVDLTEDDQKLTVPESFHGGLSPAGSVSSGYESLGSPETSECDMLWDNSVSELFPSLM